jgi:transposase-like protein
MATAMVKCPGCGKTQVYKNGKSTNGRQRYVCHASDCPTGTFQLEYRYEGARADIEEKIVAMAANASGVRDTARVLGISKDKVIDTLKKRKI